jgi:membrane associated rhomboid family serine protease
MTDSAIAHASFYPCTVDGSCSGPEPWALSWLTSMFMHRSWDHILGNMLFLAIFGKNVEDRLGHLGYLALYIVGGFVATMTHTLMTLLAGTAAEATVPTLGASGAIAAVLGAYLVFYPNPRILTLVVVWLVRIPAWIFLGVWFLYQFVEANFGPIATGSTSGGVAFFAHVGGFLFGVLIARLVAGAAARQTMATAT